MGCGSTKIDEQNLDQNIINPSKLHSAKNSPVQKANLDQNNEQNQVNDKTNDIDTKNNIQQFNVNSQDNQDQNTDQKNNFKQQLSEEEQNNQKKVERNQLQQQKQSELRKSEEYPQSTKGNQSDFGVRQTQATPIQNVHQQSQQIPSLKKFTTQRSKFSHIEMGKQGNDPQIAQQIISEYFKDEEDQNSSQINQIQEQEREKINNSLYAGKKNRLIKQKNLLQMINQEDSELQKNSEIQKSLSSSEFRLSKGKKRLKKDLLSTIRQKSQQLNQNIYDPKKPNQKSMNSNNFLEAFEYNEYEVQQSPEPETPKSFKLGRTHHKISSLLDGDQLGISPIVKFERYENKNDSNELQDTSNNQNSNLKAFLNLDLAKYNLRIEAVNNSKKNNNNQLLQRPNNITPFMDNKTSISPDQYSARFESHNPNHSPSDLQKGLDKLDSLQIQNQKIQFNHTNTLQIYQNADLHSGQQLSFGQRDESPLILNPNVLTSNQKGNAIRINRSKTIETSVLEKSFDDDGRKKLNNYVIIKQLGKGAFGKVKLVYCDIQHKYFAMKVSNKARMKRKFCGNAKTAFSLLQQEIAILKLVDHKNVVKLFEVIDDPDHDKLYLIMEYVKKGAIGSKIYWKSEGQKIEEDDKSYQNWRIPMEKLRKYARDFLQGLDYLHNYTRIIHRDIKPDNILIDEEDNLKIADFGISQILEGSMEEITGNLGTKAFLSPEQMLHGKGRGACIDIWATGVTFYFIAFCKLPFISKDMKDAITNSQEVYPEDADLQFVDFLKGCLVKDPHKRISLEGLMDHPWITKNGVEVLNRIDEDQHCVLSEQNLQRAITKLSIRTNVKVTAKLKVSLMKARKKIQSSVRLPSQSMNLQ